MYFLVVFRIRLAVFRPFSSEVIIAKVKSLDEDGIRHAFFFRKTLLCVKSSNKLKFQSLSVSSTTAFLAFNQAHCIIHIQPLIFPLLSFLNHLT
jgi:DNA-directed RNA polymerase subunit E'/Rpb7